MPSIFLPMDLAYRSRKARASSGISSLRSRSGGRWNWNHVQTVEQVFAESSLGDFLFQDPCLWRLSLETSTLVSSLLPKGRTCAFLQNAVQFYLHGETHVANLVHEECSAVGCLEQAAAIFIRSGEGAAHVTEEFGFQ